MKSHFSVLIVGDQVMAKAVQVLSEWAALGLVDPFVESDSTTLSDISGRQTGLLSDTSGQSTVDVFETLGSRGGDILRVVALAGPESEDARQLGELAKHMHSEMEGLAPPGLRTMQIRMWCPLHTQYAGKEKKPPQGLFSSHADANLVVVPEDRYSSDTLGAPVVQAESDAFLEHVAAEIATALGLWPGVPDSPIDHLEKGVLGFGEPKLHFGRSFVRLAQIDLPRFATTFDHRGRLPVPQGMVQSPYPDAAVNELAHQIEDRLLTPLRFSPAVPQVEEGWRAAVSRLAGGITRFLRRLPVLLFDLSRSPFDGMVDRDLPNSPLRSSVKQIVQGGVGAEAAPPRAEDIADDASRRFQIAGGAKVAQELWRDMGAAVLGAADGGGMTEGIEPPHSQRHRAVIADLTALAPLPERPDDDDHRLEGLIKELRQEPRTLLGRLTASFGKIIEANRKGLEETIARFNTVFGNLGRYLPSDSGWVSMVFAGLLLLLAIGLTLAAGLVDILGIMSMTGSQRSLAWIIVSGFFLAAILVIMVLAYNEPGHQTDTSDEESHNLARALGKVASVAVGVLAGAGICYLCGEVFFPSDAVAIGAAGGLLALEGGLLWAARSGLMFRKVLRRFILITMVYAALGLIGLLARDHGWYGSLAPSDRIVWMGIPTGAVAVLVLGMLIVAGWWVGREEHRLRSQFKRLASLEKDIVAAVHQEKEAREACEQFIGSAVAWSEILWRPFGLTEGPRDRGRQAQPFSIQKAALHSFRLSSGWMESVRDSLVQRIATPGWITLQYEAAVKDFQRRYAGGLAARYSEMMRPDQDPRVVSHFREEERSRISLRWRFIASLRSGGHDAVLRERLQRTQDSDGSEWVLTGMDKLTPIDADGRSLKDLLCSVFPNRDSEVHYAYFRQKALTDDLDRVWKPQVWAPTVDWPDPKGEVRLGATEIGVLRNGLHVISAIRHDLAGPYPLAALFADAAPPADRVSESPDPDSGPVL